MFSPAYHTRLAISWQYKVVVALAALPNLEGIAFACTCLVISNPNALFGVCLQAQQVACMHLLGICSVCCFSFLPFRPRQEGRRPHLDHCTPWETKVEAIGHWRSAIEQGHGAAAATGGCLCAYALATLGKNTNCATTLCCHIKLELRVIYRRLSAVFHSWSVDVPIQTEARILRPLDCSSGTTGYKKSRWVCFARPELQGMTVISCNAPTKVRVCVPHDFHGAHVLLHLVQDYRALCR
mmetsp:Transcript_47896/g.92599  ORF Transcript_47896/g.92599 Transcript_47896/m.92599 type:complete len:239 (+) Transcript_47896:417-1133(+)